MGNGDNTKNKKAEKAVKQSLRALCMPFTRKSKKIIAKER